MPRRRIPSYPRYKPKNLGLVVIDGKQHYLGPYGTPEFLAEYNRLIQEWLTRGTVADRLEPLDSSPASTLLNEIIVAFLGHAEGHYVGPDGTPTGEVYNMTVSLKPLRSLYGYTPADQFGPLALRAVRDRMIADGLSRSTINARINRIRRMFRWAASVELVPGSAVEATLPHLRRQVAAMVRIQLLTSCRTGEVVTMRGKDLTVGDPNWLYHPHKHKNSWRGQERVVILGPKSRAIVEEFLMDDPSQWLFKPGEAVAEHHARRSEGR